MWVKRTSDEIAVRRMRVRRFRRYGALGLAGFTFMVVCLIYAAWGRTGAGHWRVPAQERREQWLMALLGGLSTATGFLLLTDERPTCRCPRCGTTKFGDNQTACECGGQLEDAENLKWVERLDAEQA
jgi:hypothetical protein